MDFSWFRGAAGQSAPSAAGVACSAVHPLPELDPYAVDPDDVDLLALNSTPHQYLAPGCDVIKFELNQLSSRYTAQEIHEVKELRQRQLDAQLQQLIHHVSANTDNLTAGIQTCRAIGNLLQEAKATSDAARSHLMAAVRDADASLKVAALHQRNKNLFSMVGVSTDVVFAQQKCIEAEARLQLARQAISSPEADPVSHLQSAISELDVLERHLSQTSLKALRCHARLRERCNRLRTETDHVTVELLNLCCQSFDEARFRRLVTLHMLDVRHGADLAGRMRESYMGLVMANDQYAAQARPPCELQMAVVQDVLGSYSKADLSLGTLFREVSRTKFRGAVECVMQLQFEWLQSYNRMQQAVLDDLKATQAVLTKERQSSSNPVSEPRAPESSLPTPWGKDNGAAAAAAADAAETAAPPETTGCTGNDAVPAKARPNGLAGAQLDDGGSGGPASCSAEKCEAPSQQPMRDSEAASPGLEDVVASDLPGSAADADAERVEPADAAASDKAVSPDGTPASEAFRGEGAGEVESCVAASAVEGADDTAAAASGEVGQVEAVATVDGQAGAGDGAPERAGSDVSFDLPADEPSWVGRLLPGMDVVESLKQRERLLHEVAEVLRRIRVEFGRQAARNVVKLYESRTAVQSEDYLAVLQHGLAFEAMVAAFCSEQPEGVDEEQERLPNDYLLDVVKAACGQRLFSCFAREQRETLLTVLLPVEKCERVNVRRVPRVAEALREAMDHPPFPGHDPPLPFNYWVDNHSFCRPPAGMPWERRTRTGSADADEHSSLRGSLPGSSIAESAAPRTMPTRSLISGSTEAATEDAAPSESTASVLQTPASGAPSGRPPRGPGGDDLPLSSPMVHSVSAVSPDTVNTLSGPLAVALPPAHDAAHPPESATDAPGEGDPERDAHAPVLSPALSLASGRSHRVFLLATRHVLRVSATYMRILPTFKTTNDVPRTIVKAMQSLFEEFMLWTLLKFASITPVHVARGIGGTHDKFFRVVKRIMLANDAASKGKHFAKALQHAEAQAERSGGLLAADEAARGPGGMGAGVMGGGDLDRLVRGTIACDALATLSADLLEVAPLLHQHFYSSGDDQMLLTLCELFERGPGRLFHARGRADPIRVIGSVHEVEEVRQRCVEGAVVGSLAALRSDVQDALRKTTYAGQGLKNASNVTWLQVLEADLRMFVESLLGCTQAQKLPAESLTEIWIVAVQHIDRVVMQGLADCVATGSRLQGMMSSMVNATKRTDRREAKRGLSRDGCVQLMSDVAQLARVVAQLQPEQVGSADLFKLMVVNKWAEGCYYELTATKATDSELQQMVERWMAWAATCHGGTPEGKQQCLVLFNSLQKVRNVPDTTPWVRNLKAEVLG